MIVDQALFSLAGNLVLLGWLLLGVALAVPPDGRWRRLLVDLGGLWIPMALCAAWLALFVQLARGPSAGDLFTLDGIAARFASRDHLALLYVEVLTFSLVIFRWVIADAGERRIPRALVALLLPAQLMLGPIGLLGYLVARAAFARRRAAA